MFYSSCIHVVRQKTGFSWPHLENFLGRASKSGAFCRPARIPQRNAGSRPLFCQTVPPLTSDRHTPDEIPTYAQAQVLTLGAVWTMLKPRADQLDPPPIHHFIPGATSAALVDASAGDFVVAAIMLSLFLLLGGRFPQIAALLAFVLPMAESIVSYSIQSRPHALWVAASVGCAGVFAVRGSG